MNILFCLNIMKYQRSCIVHLLICERITPQIHTAELNKILEKTSLKTESVENFFFAVMVNLPVPAVQQVNKATSWSNKSLSYGQSLKTQTLNCAIHWIESVIHYGNSFQAILDTSEELFHILHINPRYVKLIFKQNFTLLTLNIYCYNPCGRY